MKNVCQETCVRSINQGLLYATTLLMELSNNDLKSPSKRGYCLNQPIRDDS